MDILTEASSDRKRTHLISKNVPEKCERQEKGPEFVQYRGIQ
jgi:hypothetical protein